MYTLICKYGFSYISYVKHILITLLIILHTSNSSLRARLNEAVDILLNLTEFILKPLIYCALKHAINYF